MLKLILLLIQLSFGFYNQNPTKEQLYWEIVNQEIWYQEVVYQQAICETNGGLTGVGKTKNNLFGFRTKSGYTYYKSWIESISAYKDWQEVKFRQHLDKEDHVCDYYHFLNSVGYKTGKPFCKEEINYTNYLKKIKLNF